MTSPVKILFSEATEPKIFDRKSRRNLTTTGEDLQELNLNFEQNFTRKTSDFTMGKALIGQFPDRKRSVGGIYGRESLERGKKGGSRMSIQSNGSVESLGAEGGIRSNIKEQMKTNRPTTATAMKVHAVKGTEMATARTIGDRRGFLKGLAKNAYYKKANDDFKGDSTKVLRTLKMRGKSGHGLAEGSLRAQITKNISAMKINCPPIEHLITRKGPDQYSAENGYIETSLSSPRPRPPTIRSLSRTDTGFEIIAAETLPKKSPSKTHPGKGLNSPQFLGSDLASPRDSLNKFNFSPALQNSERKTVLLDSAQSFMSSNSKNITEIKSRKGSSSRNSLEKSGNQMFFNLGLGKYLDKMEGQDKHVDIFKVF
jgi:hypothetical protein